MVRAIFFVTQTKKGISGWLLSKQIEGIKNLLRERKEKIKSLTDKMITDDIRQEFRETADQARLDYKDGKLDDLWAFSVAEYTQCVKFLTF